MVYSFINLLILYLIARSLYLLYLLALHLQLLNVHLHFPRFLKARIPYYCQIFAKKQNKKIIYLLIINNIIAQNSLENCKTYNVSFNF
jgi:hypothetical protein